MTLFICCSFSLRHCRVGLPKPDVVNSCTMNSPIVLVELHLFVRLIPATLHPCSLNHSSKKKHFFPNLFAVKPLMALLPELSSVWLIANYRHSTLAWLRDKVRGRHHRAYSLAWLRAAGSSICTKANFGSPLTRGRHHRAYYITAPGHHSFWLSL